MGNVTKPIPAGYGGLPNALYTLTVVDVDVSAGMEDVRVTAKGLTKILETNTGTAKRKEKLLLMPQKQLPSHRPGRGSTAVETSYSLVLMASQKQARLIHYSYSPQCI